jgi:hypothetical protein
MVGVMSAFGDGSGLACWFCFDMMMLSISLLLKLLSFESVNTVEQHLECALFRRPKQRSLTDPSGKQQFQISTCIDYNRNVFELVALAHSWVSFWVFQSCSSSSPIGYSIA